MKKGLKKMFAAGLAVLTAVSLAACGDNDGNTGGDNKPVGGDTFVYVPEFVDIGEDSMSNTIFEGGKLYYSSWSYDEETGVSKNPVFRYDPAAGNAEELPLKAEAGEDAYPQSIAVDGEGNIYVVWMRTVWNEDNPDDYRQETMLGKYDSSGNTVFFKDLTAELADGEENNYIQRMAVDGEGMICLVFENVIRIYDSEGSSQGAISLDVNWIESAFRGNDGKVYITYYDWNGSDGGRVAVEVDIAGKKLGTAHKLPENAENVTAGPEKGFLISDSTRLFTYDPETETSEKLLDWLDCNINGDYVQMAGMAADGRLMAVTRDWGTDKTEIVYLNKTKASDVVQKEELVIGTMSMDQGLRAAAVDFNKSSQKYHVTIREYYDYNSDMEYSDAITNMNNDITSKNCPDILDLGSGQVNVAQLAEKGVLEDLSSFLKDSSTFSRDSFVESVLRGYTYGDTLVAVPKTFYISAVAGRTSQVGDQMGWSIEDIMNFTKEHPDAELFQYVTQSEMMGILLTFNQNAFIDWEKGTCNFDTAEFRKMLEFAAGFPEEYDYDADRESTPSRLASGKLLLYTNSISNYNDIQVAEAMFNEPVTYIGFPTADGSVGCVMNAGGAYGILSKSKQKEGAWEFIESYLSREDNMFSWGFPTNKEKLEEGIADAMKVEYLTDENGEIVKDENGEPIITGMGGFGYDDWEYTYHPCTEEEMATLRELIDVAAPMPASDNEVLTIIQEEAEPYYKGQKSLDEVVNTIQSRVSMYVGENS